MVSIIKLRQVEPDLERPFKVPLYPLTPIVALIIASVALVAITVYNPTLALIYLGILTLAFAWFKITN